VYNLIGSFLSNTSGILKPESYSTDGSTFTAGNINMLTGQTSTNVTSTTWNTNTGGSAATISCARGPIILDWMSLKDITATGGAVFFAGANSTNVSGNTGLKFTGPVTNAGGGAAYSASHHQKF
jgi:hypothetical protein